MLRTFDPVAPEVAGAFDPTLFTGLPESHTPFGRYYPPTILLYLAAAGACWRWAGTCCCTTRGPGWAPTCSCATAAEAGPRRGWPASSSRSAASWSSIAATSTCSRRPPGCRGSCGRWSASAGPRCDSLIAVLAGTFLTLLALPGHLQMIAMGGLVWLTYLVYFAIAGPGTVQPAGASCWRRWRVPARRDRQPAAGAADERRSPPGAAMADSTAAFFSNGNLKVAFLPGLVGPWVLGGRSKCRRPSATGA